MPHNLILTMKALLVVSSGSLHGSNILKSPSEPSAWNLGIPYPDPELSPEPEPPIPRRRNPSPTCNPKP